MRTPSRKSNEIGLQTHLLHQELFVAWSPVDRQQQVQKRGEATMGMSRNVTAEIVHYRYQVMPSNDERKETLLSPLSPLQLFLVMT